MSTFQSQWPGTIVYNATDHHNYPSRFGLVFHNYNADDTGINFKLRGVVSVFDIITPMD